MVLNRFSQLTNKGPPYVDVKENQFQEMCSVLVLEKKFRIEIYNNDSGKWQLSKQASPGNIAQVSLFPFLLLIDQIEDILYRAGDMQDAQVMIAVILGQSSGQRTVGVAFVDVVLKQIGTMQIPDNDQLSNIESVFYQVGAKECYCLPYDPKDKDSKKLYEIMGKLDIKPTERKKAHFKVGDIEQVSQPSFPPSCTQYTNPAYARRIFFTPHLHSSLPFLDRTRGSACLFTSCDTRAYHFRIFSAYLVKSTSTVSLSWTINWR